MEDGAALALSTQPKECVAKHVGRGGAMYMVIERARKTRMVAGEDDLEAEVVLRVV